MCHQAMSKYVEELEYGLVAKDAELSQFRKGRELRSVRFDRAMQLQHFLDLQGKDVLGRARDGLRAPWAGCCEDFYRRTAAAPLVERGVTGPSPPGSSASGSLTLSLTALGEGSDFSERVLPLVRAHPDVPSTPPSAPLSAALTSSLAAAGGAGAGAGGPPVMPVASEDEDLEALAEKNARRLQETLAAKKEKDKRKKPKGL